MIRHTVKILPPKRENILISSIFLNNEILQKFGVYQKNTKVEKSDCMVFGLQLTNMENYNSKEIVYPKLYATVDLLEENGEVFKKNFKILKENGFVIESEKIKKTKIAINLIQDERIIDTAIIDIV